MLPVVHREQRLPRDERDRADRIGDPRRDRPLPPPGVGLDRVERPARDAAGDRGRLLALGRDAPREPGWAREVPRGPRTVAVVEGDPPVRGDQHEPPGHDAVPDRHGEDRGRRAGDDEERAPPPPPRRVAERPDERHAEEVRPGERGETGDEPRARPRLRPLAPGEEERCRKQKHGERLPERPRGEEHRGVVEQPQRRRQEPRRVSRRPPRDRAQQPGGRDDCRVLEQVQRVEPEPGANEERQQPRIERREVVGPLRPPRSRGDRPSPFEVVSPVENGTRERRVRPRLRQDVTDPGERPRREDRGEDRPVPRDRACHGEENSGDLGPGQSTETGRAEPTGPSCPSPGGTSCRRPGRRAYPRCRRSRSSSR